MVPLDLKTIILITHIMLWTSTQILAFRSLNRDGVDKNNCGLDAAKIFLGSFFLFIIRLLDFG